MKFTRLLCIGLALAAAAGGVAAADEDPFLWLEEVEGERALAWAREQNEHALKHLQAQPLFEPIHTRALEVLTSDARIAYPSLMGGAVYNFWRDGTHVRGLWRRTSLDEYRKPRPEWDVILDVDALAEEEEENWVWARAGCRYPDYDRCLVALSRGGADATVTREFDLEARRFVEHGFALPESKSRLAWRDRDSVFVGPALAEEELTDSGYPRLVRLWRRGQPLEEAELVFEGERGDVAVTGVRYWDGDTPWDIIVRAPSFFTRHYYLYHDGATHRLQLPEDAEVAGILGGQMLVELKSDWRVRGQTFRQGALVAARVEDLLGERPRLAVLYEPDARSSIAGVATTQGAVIVNVLDNVVGRLYSITHDPTWGWVRRRLDAPDMGAIRIVTTDDRSDRFFFNYTGFLTPSSLFEADAARASRQRVRAEPAWFDGDGMRVEQYETESADGARIPYFVVFPGGFDADRPHPTLLSGYGGFEVPRTPFYSGVLGSAWLARGGVYVLANIRGGGEFGPAWHQAALRENRQRAYDDFIAVAEDLIERGITSPQQLGIQGGSNGGLLVGAVMVQRPDLFNAVVCQVPLLDMRRFHRLLAGASWMAEYGNPDDPAQWEFIGRYSPYQNVSADAEYPQAFFTTSTRDDRVHPGHARKMVAKMRDQGHDVLYYENIEGGHGGAANLKQMAFISALMYSYLHDRLSAEPAAD